MLATKKKDYPKQLFILIFLWQRELFSSVHFFHDKDDNVTKDVQKRQRHVSNIVDSTPIVHSALYPVIILIMTAAITQLFPPWICIRKNMRIHISGSKRQNINQNQNFCSQNTNRHCELIIYVQKFPNFCSISFSKKQQ